MTDPVLAFVLIAAFLAALAAAAYFKNLDNALGREARNPLIAGVIAGALIWFFDNPPAIGIILTLVALYVRLTGSESEPSDGMILGAMTGAAAAVPLAFRGQHELLRFAQCVLAGAVAGYGITFGLTHVREKTRQLIVDAITMAIAIAAAWLVALLPLPEREIAIAVAATIPLLTVLTVFRQWPAVRAELRHDAALGVIDDEDVRTTAHPILRLGRGGWHDRAASGVRPHRQPDRSPQAPAARASRGDRAALSARGDQTADAVAGHDAHRSRDAGGR